jgi:hypothetical protein
MSLLSIIAIIVILWLLLKAKNLLSGIKITSNKSFRNDNQRTHKVGMDIQDADYEDVE